jgi:hypothetical protein
MPDKPSDNGFLVSLLTFQFGASGNHMRALKARYPDEPWRWREDWETGVIPASREGGPLSAWLTALFVCGVGYGTTFLAWEDLMRGREPLLWLVLLFPLIGTFLLFRAVLVTVRALKYGRPVLRLEQTPCPLGGRMQGTIEFQGRRLPASEAAEIEIQERHLIQTKTSKNETQSQIRVVWSLRLPLVLHGGESSVPVDLPIPSNGREADVTSPGSTSWRVCLRAATPGADLSVAFELPVFKTDGGDPTQTKAAIDATESEKLANAGEDALVAKLQNEGVRLKRYPAGLELRVRPIGLRRVGFAITALIFMGIPVAFWWFALRTHPSILRWLGFVPLALLGAMVGSLTLTKSYCVRASRKGLRIVRHILGIPSVWQIPYESIRSLKPESTMSASGSEGTVHYYDLDIEWQSGRKKRKVRMGLGINDKALASALAQALHHANNPDL